MKRSVVVLVSAVSAVALLIFGCRVVAPDGASEQRIQTASARPNIVFIMTDDMPKGLWKSMPTLKGRVSAEGARFTDAYVTQSLCCPSRATILTGEYPHNHGITGNLAPNGGEAEFRNTGQDQDTIATRMQAEGYRTALIGKYMNGYEGEYVPPGWSYWYTEAGRHRVNDNGRTTASPPEAYPVTIASRARAFLDGATDEAGDPPFMLFYWTTQPHLPAKAPPGYRNGFQSAELPRPPSFDETDVSDKPAYIKSLPGLTGEKVDRLQTKHLIQLRTMSHVDDTLKGMLDLLENRGELANTYVVFATDNGVHMGQHRYIIPRGSKSTPYEEAASTPLMIRGPGVPHGVVRTQLVANNDLAPTFAAWADLPPPENADGRSITPLLSERPPSTWRTALLNESRLVKPEDQTSPNYEAIFTASGERYVEYATDEKELYDLKTDPYELTNSYDAAAPPTSLASRLRVLEKCAGETCRKAENGQ
jgi:N-acetylglucosamine-6-sulfatase